MDTNVISGLLERWSQSVRESVAEGGPRLLLQFALFLLIVFAFLKLAQIGQRLVDRGLSSSRVQLSELLTRMVISTTRNLIIVVGVLMMASAAEVKWRDVSDALPAFLTMVAMPLTFSIANGVALGIVAYPIVKRLGGRSKEVHPLIDLLAVLFIARYLFID